jgi:uncharacterized protein YejL (UPF0352 family)
MITQLDAEVTELLAEMITRLDAEKAPYELSKLHRRTDHCT